jgi:hypothetical protein
VDHEVVRTDGGVYAEARRSGHLPHLEVLDAVNGVVPDFLATARERASARKMS